MRRLIVLLLIAILWLCYGTQAEVAQKAPDYILEGYDGDSVTRNWETNLFFSRMQERTSISFQFRQYSDYSRWAERKEEIAKGQDLPDVLFKAGLNASEIRDLYERGILIDLKPYLEMYAPDLWALLQEKEEWMNAVSMSDGGIPALPCFNELQNNDLLWINRSWLDRLKIEMPTNLEELTEVLRSIKTEDPNRNGKSDEVPLSFIGMWELRFLGHAYGIADNDDYVFVRDGQAYSSLTAETNREFLSWMHQLWEEDLLDHNGFSNADSLRQITDEKVSIPYGAFFAPTPLTVVPVEALDQYEAVLPLTFRGSQIYRDLTGDVVRGTFAITGACSEPEKLIAWVNFLYTEEGSMLAQCGQEGEDYIWNEEGYWEWESDLATVANEILPDHTISDGGIAPGLIRTSLQLKYADEVTRHNVEQLAAVKEKSVFPYPYITLSREDEAKVNSLRNQLMPWAEETMAQFVTGDLELNDENWKFFCDTAEQKGLTELLEVWNRYLHPVLNESAVLSEEM